LVHWALLTQFFPFCWKWCWTTVNTLTCVGSCKPPQAKELSQLNGGRMLKWDSVMWHFPCVLTTLLLYFPSIGLG
jgi:hypothetical protein